MNDLNAKALEAEVARLIRLAGNFGYVKVHTDTLNELSAYLSALPQAGTASEEMVEDAAKAYATATGYYVDFHRGLKSNSSDLIRKGVRAALEAALSLRQQEEADTITISVERFKAVTAQAERYEAYERLSHKEAVPVADVTLVMAGDGRFYDEGGGEWVLSDETYAERTKDCKCAHCLARRAVPADAGEPSVKALLDQDLLERLEKGVVCLGIHEDNSTELFDIEYANDTMAEAAQFIRSVIVSPKGSGK